MNRVTALISGVRPITRTDLTQVASYFPFTVPGLPLTCHLARFLATKQGKSPNNVQKVKRNLDKQEVEIMQRMTVSALAQAMNKDFDHIFEALLNTSMDLDSLEPQSILEEKWIKEVVKRSGMKFKWAKLVESKERENKDAQRRWRTFGLIFCSE
uniref:Translation initiation factor IF-2, mitochondrial n=1 Tax=Esox lucius TaxID=8010 RepID=C1BYA4_ESOLU|nr:Translation initiation factor IF-2, mitochondrial precursor [Esox lucius]